MESSFSSNYKEAKELRIVYLSVNSRLSISNEILTSPGDLYSYKSYKIAMISILTHPLTLIGFYINIYNWKKIKENQTPI